MSRDTNDEYIKEHIQSMSMQEMADHLGLSKSTVSRRAAKLRASGEIDETIAQAMKRETQQARNDLEDCALSNMDRLAKLDALKSRLEEELGMTGGANLARVSSEYRKVLEEMAAISTNLEIAYEQGREVTPFMISMMKGRARKALGYSVDIEIIDKVIETTLDFLNDKGVIKCSKTSRLKAMQDGASKTSEPREGEMRSG